MSAISSDCRRLVVAAGSGADVDAPLPEGPAPPPTETSARVLMRRFSLFFAGKEGCGPGGVEARVCELPLLCRPMRAPPPHPPDGPRRRQLGDSRRVARRREWGGRLSGMLAESQMAAKQGGGAPCARSASGLAARELLGILFAGPGAGGKTRESLDVLTPGDKATLRRTGGWPHALQAAERLKGARRLGAPPGLGERCPPMPSHLSRFFSLCALFSLSLGRPTDRSH
jgi:hypothetical protein